MSTFLGGDLEIYNIKLKLQMLQKEAPNSFAIIMHPLET